MRLVRHNEIVPFDLVDALRRSKPGEVVVLGKIGPGIIRNIEWGDGKLTVTVEKPLPA